MIGTSSAILAARMRDAALSLLGSLGPAERVRASIDFGSEQRFDWHYVPRERRGLPLQAMSTDQRGLAFALLRIGLSERGYTKAETIRQLEVVLRQIEGRAFRDPELYYFTVFGDPSDPERWGWRYEGHHLSQNWTIVGGRALSTSPQFFGANPAQVFEGPMKGSRPLAPEEDLARALVKSLDKRQRAAAIVDASAPRDIITAAARRATALDDRGISYTALHGSQERALGDLIDQHAGSLAPALAEERLAKVRDAGLASVKFAWMGGIEKGQGHYYRIQGPTFLVEYDNTQNTANHVHVVWRDFNGDFGLDLLQEHYRRDPHG
jgi:Protein of unknown function (DUF3500)